MSAMDAATVASLKRSMREESERDGPPAGFPRLPLIPAGRYTDRAFLALEHEWLWRRSWLYAGHADELPRAGDYLQFRRTGSPILLVRGKDLEVRAFYNSCRHRGAPLVSDACGHVEGFSCPFHGWSYALDGRLVGLRDRRDFVGLELADYPLLPVRCESFGNWIFVNEDPDADPLLAHLDPIPAWLEQVRPAALRLVDRRSYRVRCHAKVLLEAFLEVYHLKTLHAGSVDRFLDHRGSTIALWPRGHSVMLTPNRDPEWQDPGTRGMRRVETATEIVSHNNLSLNFFPNLVTPVDPSGIPFLLFWPLGPRESEVEVIWFAPDWGGGPRAALWETRIANFERILAEDTSFAERLQESVESRGWRGSTLNYQERRIYHWHEELDRRIGASRIPEALRVEPVLGPWVAGGDRAGN
jgi:phenylpropionate dioxygenase-like ring-hydroxylating dioxygenase large terminal subunit